MMWTGQDWGFEQPRFAMDLTGDGKADILGFGRDGVWTALGKDGWELAPANWVLPGFFGYDRGWRTGQHLRLLADLTADGKADIIGFGNDGVWTALSNGDGTFRAPRLVLEAFHVNQGWRVDQHPRFLMDLTGDGKADIVGFGNDGVWTALSNGDGTFRALQLVLEGFHVNQGWRVDQHPRFLVDLTGDGKADIVGFGNDGVWTAVSNGDGTFQAPRLVLEGFHLNQGWRVDQHPRFLVDLTGDGKADIVGFGNDGVWTAVSNGDGTFGEPKFLPMTFSVKEGWRVDQHLRLVVDLNGDGKADLIGFGNDGILTAVSNGDGTFQPARFVRADIAPPPAIKRKVVPWQFVQRKLDLFFNLRSRPLFKVRFHNLGSGDHRHSTVDFLFDDPVKGYISQLHDGQPKDLGQLEVTLPWLPDPDFHFSDLNSSALTANVIPGSSVGIEVRVDFEVEGVEMIVNNFPDIDFDGFNIQVGFILEHDRDAGFVDVQVSKDRIKTHASVNVADPVPDGKFASGVEKEFNGRIADALKEYQDALNQIATRWLIGGDFYVVGVASNAEALTIDYIIPPGQLEPFPETPQPPLDPGPLANIDHIVVLMMENRSFDHMLGYLSHHGGRSDIDGLRGGEKNRHQGQDYESFILADTIFPRSPDHSHDGVVNQIAGGACDGFVTSFATKYPELDPRLIMGYHNAAHVPVYNALAREFLACHRWFSSHPGPTFCNRFYTLTGRLNRDAFTGEFEFDNFSGDAFRPVSTRTILDHLTEQGVDWRYYEHRYCFLRLFGQYTTDDHFIVEAKDPVKGFFASAQAGTLPAVSFIDPNFIDEPDGQDNDDGAPADITAGQKLIGDVVNAVMQGPKWQKTLLIITYDEHGGFYDHVNPLDSLYREKAEAVSNAGHKSGEGHYGLRVPAFVISPWVDQGKVSDVVFDHTSIPKTIARRFMSANPPDLGERVAAANDLSMVLRSSPRQDISNIPVPPEPPPRAAAAPVPDGDDFKQIMRMLRDRKLTRPTGSISGTVINADTQERLVGKVIQVKGSEIIARTDNNGNFTLEGIPQGPQTVLFIMRGFRDDVTRTVTVVPGQSVSVGTVAMPVRTFTGTLIGQVVDDTTQAPIPGATVAVTVDATGTSFQTHTDTNGQFEFLKFPAGFITITVSKEGFTSKTLPGQVKEDRTGNAGAIRLVPN
ncbi:MAG: carboxypeptidase regulatory-like domain-containing protein [Nitrospira sp.]|nr:carboxypeptidase regulatory-like domain-containing protein [Nitrospira sp.]